jgi:proteic killer suppression protein
VIVDFGDRATEDIYNGKDTRDARRMPSSIWGVARRKLDMIDAAHALTDLRVPTGNRLESLKGDLVGYHSIRVNDQYRIVFRFGKGSAGNVRITDYHS